MGERPRRSREKNESSRSRSWNSFSSFLFLMLRCFTFLLLLLHLCLHVLPSSSFRRLAHITAWNGCNKCLLLRVYISPALFIPLLNDFSYPQLKSLSALGGNSRFQSGRSQGQGLNRNSISVAQRQIRKLPDDSVALQPSFGRKDVPHRAVRGLLGCGILHSN